MYAPEARNVDRRSGPERRRRCPIVVPWQQPCWDSGNYTGPERRVHDRRDDTDRQVSAPSPVAFSDEPPRQLHPRAAVRI